MEGWTDEVALLHDQLEGIVARATVDVRSLGGPLALNAAFRHVDATVTGFTPGEALALHLLTGAGAFAVVEPTDDQLSPHLVGAASLWADIVTRADAAAAEAAGVLGRKAPAAIALETAYERPARNPRTTPYVERALLNAARSLSA